MTYRNQLCFSLSSMGKIISEISLGSKLPPPWEMAGEGKVKLLLLPSPVCPDMYFFFLQ